MPLTLYGVADCYYTQQQRKAIKGLRGITYVDCDKKPCPDNVAAQGGWPVWDVCGELHVGARPRRQVQGWLKRSKRCDERSKRGSKHSMRLRSHRRR